MKALSVKQPWASLIVAGTKDVENRTWSTPHRGRLVIASTRQADLTAEKRLTSLGVPAPPDPLLGYALGVVTVVDCVQDAPSRWATPGVWHWVLARPHPFPEPFPVRGQIGIFDVDIPDHVAKALGDELLDLIGGDEP